MDDLVKRMKATSPRENGATRAAQQEDSSGANSDMTSCTYCLGVSVYTKALLDQRLPPRCKGLEFEIGAPRDRMETLKNKAPAPRHDEFTFLGIGVSVYSRAWMYEGKHLPAVKGLGVIAIEESEDDNMEAIEERKGIMRELEKERRRRRRQHGDVDDDEDDELDDDDDGDDDDDDDFDLVEELFGDDRSADASAFLEKDPLASVGKPRMPPMLPTITFEDLVNKSVENAKYSVNAMYTFWAKRLDGIGERYLDSCHRIAVQMEKQATSVPQNCMWLVHRIEETIMGKSDGGKK